jgi:hypothetical protein
MPVQRLILRSNRGPIPLERAHEVVAGLDTGRYEDRPAAAGLSSTPSRSESVPAWATSSRPSQRDARPSAGGDIDRWRPRRAGSPTAEGDPDDFSIAGEIVRSVGAQATNTGPRLARFPRSAGVLDPARGYARSSQGRCRVSLLVVACGGPGASGTGGRWSVDAERRAEECHSVAFEDG